MTNNQNPSFTHLVACSSCEPLRLFEKRCRRPLRGLCHRTPNLSMAAPDAQLRGGPLELPRGFTDQKWFVAGMLEIKGGSE